MNIREEFLKRFRPHSLTLASIDYFLKTGTVSGELHLFLDEVQRYSNDRAVKQDAAYYEAIRNNAIYASIIKQLATKLSPIHDKKLIDEINERLKL